MFLALLKSYRTANSAHKKFHRIVENCERKRDGEEPILTCGQRLRKFLRPACPWLDSKAAPENAYQRMFFRGSRENYLFRLGLSIALWEAFGILMYFILAFKYAMDPGKTGTVVGAITHLILTIMFLIPQVMNYFLLAIYRMATSKIKTLLMLGVISLAFEVVAMNAMTNVHRVAEGIACIQTDVSASAAAVDENLASHGQMGLEMMQKLVVKLSGPMNFFKEMMRKLDTKMTRAVEMVRQSWATLSEMTNNCKKIMRGPYLVCLNKFHHAYIGCLSRERVLGLNLCSTIQRANAICDMGKAVGDSVCSFPGKVKNGIVEGALPYFKNTWQMVKEKVNDAQFHKITAVQNVFQKGKTMKQEIKNLNTLNLRVEMKHTSSNEIKGLGKKVRAALRRMIATPKRIIWWIGTVIHWTLIPLALVYPFFSTAFFVYKFNYRDTFRNIYLTGEFGRIDDDCALKGHSKVLPLNKDEKELYVNRWSLKMTKKEKRWVWLGLSLTTLAMATPLFFIFLDVALYTTITSVFDIFQRTTIDFPAHYELKVSGNTTGGSIMTALLETFSPLTEGMDARKERWKSCFREPSPPSWDVIFGMFVLFLVCLVLCPTGVWLERQTLCLADFFYPGRVRRRSLALYNEILRRRQHLMTFMYARQRAVLADDQMAGREQLVRRGMQSRGFVRVNCVKCKKTQMRLADEPNVRLCIQCGTFYCISCFCFTEECLDCEQEMQTIDGLELWHQQLSEDEFSEEEDEESEKEEEEEEENAKVRPSGSDFEQPSATTTKQAV